MPRQFRTGTTSGRNVRHLVSQASLVDGSNGISTTTHNVYVVFAVLSMDESSQDLGGGIDGCHSSTNLAWKYKATIMSRLDVVLDMTHCNLVNDAADAFVECLRSDRGSSVELDRNPIDS
jgi:hypothetical protein